MTRRRVARTLRPLNITEHVRCAHQPALDIEVQSVTAGPLELTDLIEAQRLTVGFGRDAGGRVTFAIRKYA